MHVPSLSPDDQTLFDMLRKVSVDSVCGILAGLGYPDQFISGIRPINEDVKMVGRALTIRYFPIRKDLAEQAKRLYPYGITHHAVEATRPGDVMVVDAGGCTESGFIGDLILSRFIIKGGAGIVVDGAIRDLSAIRHMGLPVYVKGVHAAVSQRRLVGFDYNAPVRCSEVTILPGDIIVGDAEGVIVIPAALAADVAERGVALEHREAFLRKVLERGERPIHEVYPPNADVLREYEEYKKQIGFPRAQE